MKIRQVRISELTPDPQNVRSHSTRNLEAIQKSLARYGQQKPIVVDRYGVVIAGNGFLEAARELGWDKVATVQTQLTGAEARAYGIADNRTAELASWDDPALAALLSELEQLEFDLGDMGFTEEEMLALVADADGAGGRKSGLTDPDATPDEPTEVWVKDGDLFRLGPHRLMCGDATDPDQARKALGGNIPFLMVTDPPYGVEYDPAWRQEAAQKGAIGYGARATGKVQNDDRADWTPAWKLFPGEVAYVWHSALNFSPVLASMEAADFKLRSQIIWKKSRFAISRGHYHWKHEPCLYMVRKGRKAHWTGDRTQTTVWEIDHAKNDTGHGTQKPVECMLVPIQNHGEDGDGVYDPFVGSGTTIIACEQAGRRCFAMDIDPAYVQIALQRWEEFTGEKAEKA